MVGLSPCPRAQIATLCLQKLSSADHIRRITKPSQAISYMPPLPAIYRTRSYRRLIAVTGANAVHGLDARNPDLAIPDVARVSGGDDGVDSVVSLVISYN